MLRATAAAAADQATANMVEDMEYSKAASGILQYALNLALTSETYEAHTWMIVLGLLKQEDCRAAAILKDLGLVDLYGAWNEVLWALNVSNGLEPRAYTPDVSFAPSAVSIITGSQNFATWAGRTKVQSEDILLALAAGHVLTGLFPDLGLTFDAVRQSAAKHGGKYKLPDDTAEEVAALQEENFL